MYVKLTNGVPEIYSIGQLRRDNPGISFPKTIRDTLLVDFNVFPVKTDDRPTIDNRTQSAALDSFEHRADGWYRTWTVSDKSVEEVEAYDEDMKAAIKAEARRRILAFVPDWKQQNLTARAAELAIKGPTNWSLAEQAEYDAGQAAWDQVKAIRVASDVLESMQPVPEDFSDDRHWPTT